MSNLKDADIVKIKSTLMSMLTQLRMLKVGVNNNQRYIDVLEKQVRDLSKELSQSAKTSN